ncbi:YfhO family protein, partial [candidate division WOR-3 bacterium]|nr:YfhO family protein [candidate division WOR-3 bacterium]
LLLALLAIAFKRREKYVRFFIGLCVVTVIFAIGGHTPLYRIPYWILPGLKKLRCPTMIFYLTSFGIAVLSAFGVQALENSKLKTQNLKILLGIIFGIVVIFAIICSVGKESMLSSLKTHWSPILLGKYGPQLTQQKLQNLSRNYPNFLGGLGKALLLIVINSFLILLLAMKRLKLGIWILIAVPILIFDQWSVEKKFLKTVSHPKQYYAPDEIVSFLGNPSRTATGRDDRELYRVFPLNYEHSQDGYLSLYNIQSLGGYVSNPGDRYQKLIGAGESVMFTPLNLIRHRNMLDILNAKYVISMWIPEDLSKYPPNTQQAIKSFKDNFLRKWGISWEEAHKGLKLVYRSNRGYGIYENETALPRAWIVHSFKVLSREEILEELKNPTFHPDTTVLLEEQPLRVSSSELRVKSSEEVKIREYTPNRIVCNVILETPGFLVFSDNWHPDWKVYVDGKREKLYVADYTLRAVQLDKGEHQVEFKYDSLYFKLGAIISSLAFLFFLGTIGFWFKFYRRRK